MTPGTRMAEPENDLRADVDRRLGALDGIDPLSDERYHRTHERFEAASDQRQRILDWFERFIGHGERADTPISKVLSIGCGGGVMDRRIVDVIAEHSGPIHLTGVDPNPEHIDAFTSAFGATSHQVDAFAGGFEDFRSERRFDLVYFLHCLYYFETIEQPLIDAAERLAPGGALVVLQAPNDDLNHLADRVWRKQFEQSAWYSDDVADVLAGMDGRTTRTRIEAWVDVTPCFRPGDPSGVELLDFIVQADTRDLPEALGDSLRDSLRSICETRGDRLRVSHPVDALVFQPGAA